MRKIIFLMHASLDGKVAGPNGEMDWITYPLELTNAIHSLHDRTDTAIYGRVTYEMMDGYWPAALEDPNIDERDKRHAHWYKDANKVVVSHTLTTTKPNTQVIGDNLKEAFTQLKQQPGKDMWLLGSATLAQSLMALGLIDEYWISVSPTVLGEGKPLFSDTPLKLALLDAQTFPGGAVLLRYKTA